MYFLRAPLQYLLTCVCMLINGWHSDKHQERFWHIVLPCVLSLTFFEKDGLNVS